MNKNIFVILAWGLYDLANQFFALNIVSLYFVRWLTIEKAIPEIFYSISFGISCLFIAISAPILGNISDASNRRMPFLIWLTLLSVIFTMLLGVSENIIIALLFFAIANFGCQAAVVFYNALLVNIAPKSKIGLVSGIGRMMGYCGALLALYIIKPIVLKSGYRATFFPTGVLFLIFAIPCMVFIKDKQAAGPVKTAPKLKDIILNYKKFPGLADFLKAAFFCLCVVNAIILFMSVYATKVFRLDETQIINLVGFSTLFAIAGSFASGFLSDFFGAKRSLLAVIILWQAAVLSGAFITNSRFYLFIGALAGAALGSVWTVARVLTIRIVPEGRVGEVFGLFNLVGYLSSIAGSIFWGLLSWWLLPLKEIGYRITLLSMSIFLVLSFIFLLRVKEKRSEP